MPPIAMLITTGGQLECNLLSLGALENKNYINQVFI